MKMIEYPRHTNRYFNLKIAVIAFLSVFVFAKDSFCDNGGYLTATSLVSKDKKICKLESDPWMPREENKSLTEAQKEARSHYASGRQAQKLGDLSSAMSWYQKAIIIDPTYAAAYNDLGAIYEAKGFLDRAEQSYLQALIIDKNYLVAYTNLALFYEKNRDLKQAEACWYKRAILASKDDPWAQEARRRYEDIKLVLSDSPLRDIREEKTINLVRKTEAEKALLKSSNKELAKLNFQKAQKAYKKNDDVTALKLAIDANQLDPDSEEINKFIEKVQERVLTR